MIDKLKNGLFKLKSYWNKPPKGYDVCYKEFLYFTIGSGGLSFLAVLVSATNITYSSYLLQSFGISPGSSFILATILGSLIALIRAPILSMIIDNSNGKGSSKFKPLLMWSAVVSTICFIFIPFIPKGWINDVVLTFTMPSIPIFGITTPQLITFSTGLIVAFTLIQVGTFFYTIFMQAMTGIDQTISTVAQERANLFSFRGIVSNIPGSVINLAAPIIAGIFFGGSLTNINLYKITFPIAAIGGLICLSFMKNVKERVVVNKEYKAKVKFSEGAKSLSTNKYFWIITIFNIAVGVRGVSNIVNLIQMSYVDGDLMKTAVGVFNTTILMSILIVGMVTAPVLIKKFGKKKVMLWSSFGYALMVAFQLLVYKNRALILLSSLFQNVFGGFAFVSTIMVTDILDYQQWKTGKRLEGFWQNYGGFIGTLIGFFTGALPAIFLNLGGVDFGKKPDDFVMIPALRDGAFLYSTILGLIGSILCIVPLLFYDLDEKKHAQYVKSLKIKVAVDNFKSNQLTDENIINVDIITREAKETNNVFLLNEISKFDVIEEILADTKGAYDRIDATNRAENISNLLRDLELEDKKIIAKVANEKAQAENNRKKLELEDKKIIAKVIKEKEQAEKNRKEFDDTSRVLELKSKLRLFSKKNQIEFNEVSSELVLRSKSRFFRFFANENSTYPSLDEINNEIDMFYDHYSSVLAKENRQRIMRIFISNIEKDFARILNKLNALKKQSEKQEVSFDSEKVMTELKSKSKYFKHFIDSEFSQLNDLKLILINIEKIYDIYFEKTKNEY